MAHRPQVGRRILSREIHDHHERAAAADVPKEQVAEPLALVRALDQSGHVGDHEALLALCDPEVGHDRGERIGRDLRPRGRELRKERRLPRVRQSDESDVGDRSKLDVQPLLLADLACLRASRYAVLRSRERRVAPPAPPSACDDGARSLADEVGQQPVFVLDAGSVRNRDPEIATRSSGSIRPGARLAALGLLVRMVGEPREVPHPAGDLEQDGAAVSAVSAVRTAPGLVGLAVQGRRAVASSAGPDEHGHVVDEAHRL